MASFNNFDGQGIASINTTPTSGFSWADDDDDFDINACIALDESERGSNNGSLANHAAEDEALLESQTSQVSEESATEVTPFEYLADSDANKAHYSNNANAIEHDSITSAYPTYDENTFPTRPVMEKNPYMRDDDCTCYGWRYHMRSGAVYRGNCFSHHTTGPSFSERLTMKVDWGMHAADMLFKPGRLSKEVTIDEDGELVEVLTPMDWNAPSKYGSSQGCFALGSVGRAKTLSRKSSMSVSDEDAVSIASTPTSSVAMSTTTPESSRATSPHRDESNKDIAPVEEESTLFSETASSSSTSSQILDDATPATPAENASRDAEPQGPEMSLGDDIKTSILEWMEESKEEREEASLKQAAEDLAAQDESALGAEIPSSPEDSLEEYYSALNTVHMRTARIASCSSGAGVGDGSLVEESFFTEVDGSEAEKPVCDLPKEVANKKLRDEVSHPEPESWFSTAKMVKVAACVLPVLVAGGIYLARRKR